MTSLILIPFYGVWEECLSAFARDQTLCENGIDKSGPGVTFRRIALGKLHIVICIALK